MRRTLSALTVLIGAAVAALSAVPSPGARALAQGGAIRGRVTTPQAPPASPRPMVGDLGTTSPDTTDRRRAVVYLDPAPRQALEELPAGHARMDQRNEEFVPHVLAITVGTIVDFPNDDTKFHNVFSLSSVKTFDLGRYPAGRSKSVRFDKSGIVPVNCDIHSHMQAFILVFNHTYFAMVDDSGRYTLPNVPPGNYILKVWSELGKAEPQAVTVTEGVTVEHNFSVERPR
jgi:plastocyanin